MLSAGNGIIFSYKKDIMSNMTLAVSFFFLYAQPSMLDMCMCPMLVGNVLGT